MGSGWLAGGADTVAPISSAALWATYLTLRPGTTSDPTLEWCKQLGPSLEYSLAKAHLYTSPMLFGDWRGRNYSISS
jgi:hypothetical protein